MSGARWTAEQDEELKRRLAGGQSFGEIKKGMGVTRNAAIGRAARLGLSNGRKPGGYGGKRPADESRPASKPAGRLRNVTRLFAIANQSDPGLVCRPPEVVADPSKLRTILELRAHHCRWPVDGEGLATRFCGADKHENLPYCAAHCRIAYQRQPDMFIEQPKPAKQLSWNEIFA